MYWVLTVAGRYVLIASGGGRAAYRLSHKLLADHLHPPRRWADRLDHDPDTGRVAKAVIDFYRRLLDGGASPESHHYLWHYAWQHCSDAGIPGIGLLRRLAVDQPAFEPDLAVALASLSAFYREAGRLAEAVPVAEDALDRFRALSEDLSYLPELATALSDLGVYYREVGRLDEAVSVAEEAVDRFRVLAAGNPAHLPGLALVVSNLGGCYQAGGRLDEAVSVAEEAVDRFRVLAGDSPAHLPGLAMALINLKVSGRLGVWLRRSRSLRTPWSGSGCWRVTALLICLIWPWPSLTWVAVIKPGGALGGPGR